MDIDTLLTRQMELHTSMRKPPKTPEDLAHLRDTMREYNRFLKKLHALSEQLAVEQEVIFQCLMHISVGGVVNFDRQHQDGSVPMHQAKVLARSGAIELEDTLRRVVPHEELMVYVGMCKDVRNAVRVKMEDGNDLITANKSIGEAVEYLNFIDAHSKGDIDKMFAFYMVEDEVSLSAMLEDSGVTAFSGTNTMTLTATRFLDTTSSLGAPFQSSSERQALVPLPSPLSSFTSRLEAQCEVAAGLKVGASERLAAAQTLLDWITVVPVEHLAPDEQKGARPGPGDGALCIIGATVATLMAEKRSALCRLGCETASVAIGRASTEQFLIEDVDRVSDVGGGSAEGPRTVSGVLRIWATTLAKGIFVTVSAIATATDKALRELVIESHGHLAVVKSVLVSLEGGTQTELRRKCLGYLALSVAAANDHRPESVTVFSPLLVPVAQKYVSIGDSPSRKMARALCSVLRHVAGEKVPLEDARVERLVQEEEDRVGAAVLSSARDLEQLLFGSNNFMSSMRSTFSSTNSQLARRLPPTASSVREDARSVRAARPMRRASGDGVPPLARPGVVASLEQAAVVEAGWDTAAPKSGSTSTRSVRSRCGLETPAGVEARRRRRESIINGELAPNSHTGPTGDSVTIPSKASLRGTSVYDTTTSLTPVGVTECTYRPLPSSSTDTTSHGDPRELQEERSQHLAQHPHTLVPHGESRTPLDHQRQPHQQRPPLLRGTPGGGTPRSRSSSRDGRPKHPSRLPAMPALESRPSAKINTVRTDDTQDDSAYLSASNRLMPLSLLPSYAPAASSTRGTAPSPSPGSHGNSSSTSPAAPRMSVSLQKKIDRVKGTK